MEQWRSVSPHWFKTHEISLLRGRLFTETDADKSPSVCHDQLLRLWLVDLAKGRSHWDANMTIGKGVAPEFTDATRPLARRGRECP